MKRVRVEIDLNARNADGLTLTKVKNVHGDVRELQQGQIVTAFESEDSVQALAMVKKVDLASGFLYLDVNWASMCDDNGVEVRVPGLANEMNRAAAHVANAHAASTGATRSRTQHRYLELPSSSIGTQPQG